ncbi:SDR family oxidoreductase [Polaribacter sp. HL-MS24]|uniref:SDR family oxidoreductase n=1 Tax=Polaribacter sp. HL-MS24 TaxID=3077735 RepID=UPI0029350787|nr:SDR family oxidoreductase [Polaribacter sp. HL-MS24]WOC39888.1 SDR family oxidoreductase [Polaribacter sp. HL-MS24]
MSKVVIVTGASSGIGKAIATLLNAEGCKVYGTSRNPSTLTSSPFEMIALDVLDTETIEHTIRFILDKEGRIDVLVNNAGMGITGSLEETPNFEMRRAFDTNFFGAIDMMKAVLPQMRAQKSGTIINITSIAGYMGLPFRGVYCATKAALEIITEAIRMEIKSFGIDVVNIAPGDVATNIVAGRYHTPVFEDSAYKEVYEANLDLINADVTTGIDPSRIAKKVHQIIHKKNPKIHYKVGGFMEKFSIVLKRILPDYLFEKLLRNHYKI